MLEEEEVVEQVAEVGLVDPELALHRRAGEADLVALDAATGRDQLLDLEQLDLVGVLEVVRQVARQGLSGSRGVGLE